MKYILFLFILTTIAGCRYNKEEIDDPVVDPPIEAECVELGDPPGLLEWTYVSDGQPDYFQPCYNPNNVNEIIYSTNGSKVYKYNFITHERTFIFEGTQIAAACWGSNGWILLNPNDANVWKIRDDGTELTQLTFSGQDYSPHWNTEGTMFVVSRSFNGPHKTILFTDIGEPMDTMNWVNVGNNSSWLHPTYIVSMSNTGPKVFDPYGDSLVYWHEGNFQNATASEWISNTEFVWAYRNGIYRTNYVTGQTTQIKESCYSRLYLFPTYHAASNKLIWRRSNLTHLHDNIVEATSRLYMMNTDGTGEAEIHIPQ